MGLEEEGEVGVGVVDSGVVEEEEEEGEAFRLLLCETKSTRCVQKRILGSSMIPFNDAGRGCD